MAAPARPVVALAAVFGLTAVAAGAFATHGLEEAGAAQAAGWVETASRYQMWHALAALACAALLPDAKLPPILWALGIVLFSGSLYALAAGGPRLVVYLTPIGGLCLIAGWLALIWAALRPAPRRP